MLLPTYMKLNLSKGMGYSWAYLCTSTSTIVRIFKRMSRCGSPQSDWVSGRAWSSPIVPIAPPEGV
jgi:hypothetical protein